MKKFDYEVVIDEVKYKLEFEQTKLSESRKYRKKALAMGKDSTAEQVEDFMDYRLEMVKNQLRNKPEGLTEDWIEEIYADDFEAIATKLEETMKVIPDFAKSYVSQQGQA